MTKKCDQNQIMCRYTWRVIRDLQHDKGILSKIISVPLDTALVGWGSDSFFEIYTESGDRPIVIQELD
jgi:hypothetical protein